MQIAVDESQPLLPLRDGGGLKRIAGAHKQLQCAFALHALKRLRR